MPSPELAAFIPDVVINKQDSWRQLAVGLGMNTRERQEYIQETIIGMFVNCCHYWIFLLHEENETEEGLTGDGFKFRPDRECFHIELSGDKKFVPNLEKAFMDRFWYLRDRQEEFLDLVFREINGWIGAGHEMNFLPGCLMVLRDGQLYMAISKETVKNTERPGPSIVTSEFYDFKFED